MWKDSAVPDGQGLGGLSFLGVEDLALKVMRERQQSAGMTLTAHGSHTIRAVLD